MAKTKKFYVVWKGHEPGIYANWGDCQEQINGYSDAQFKSFKSRKEAEMAFHDRSSVRPSKNKKKLYYVVWIGQQPGVYTSWEDAQKQIKGGTKAKYKSFGSKQIADKAFRDGPDAYIGRSFKGVRDLSDEESKRIGSPVELSLSVDAACNGRSGVYEYQGVITDSKTRVFHAGPFKNGSNNIGEFLALVHGLAYLKKNRSDLPIYSDSRTAMSWVRRGRANSTVKNAETDKLINRAEKWLADNSWDNTILKWETKAWGDIPADFNRK